MGLGRCFLSLVLSLVLVNTLQFPSLCMKKDRLEQLRSLKSSLQADVKKYEAYMASLESLSSSLSQKTKSITEEQEAVGKEKLLNITTLF